MKNLVSFISGTVAVIISLAYFLSCLTHLISPVFFSPMVFLSLGFPYLAAAMVFLIVGSLFINKKMSLVFLAILLLGFVNLRAGIALNPFEKNEQAVKDTNSIRVLSWNVKNFDNNLIVSDTPNSIRNRMLEFIKLSNADVLCLQEFIEYEGGPFLKNIEALEKIGYTYYYFPKEILTPVPYSKIYSGSAIFSKLPITGSGKTLLGDASFPEHIIYTDLVFGGKPVRLFNTHLRSFGLYVQPTDTITIIPFHYDEAFYLNRSKAEKLRIISQEHTRQAAIAKKEMNLSPYPVIFAADLNSVPASYAYHSLSVGLKDAFLEKGFGLGNTMVDKPKTLRIDYVFADKVFQVKSFKKYPVKLSDHYPLVADLGW